MENASEVIRESRQALAETGIVIPKPLPGETPLAFAIRCSLYLRIFDEGITTHQAEVDKLTRAKIGSGIGMKESLKPLSDDEVVRLILETPNFNRQEMEEQKEGEPFFPKSSALFKKIANFLEEQRCPAIVKAGDKLLPSFVATQKEKTQELAFRWAVFLASVADAYPKAFNQETIDEAKNPLAAAVNTPAHRELWQNQGFAPTRPLNGFTWQIAK